MSHVFLWRFTSLTIIPYLLSFINIKFKRINNFKKTCLNIRFSISIFICWLKSSFLYIKGHLCGLNIAANNFYETFLQFFHLLFQNLRTLSQNHYHKMSYHLFCFPPNGFGGVLSIYLMWHSFILGRHVCLRNSLSLMYL